MGLMNKFKNLFTDEEVIEEDEDEKVEIKEIKKEEPKLPTFMREKIAKESSKPQVMEIEDKAENANNIDDEEVNKEIKLEEKLNDEKDSISEEKQSFKFPIEFSEEDFVETRTSRQNLHARERTFDIDNKEKINPEIIKQHSEIKSKSQNREIKKVSDLYKDKKEEKKEEKKFRATPIISPIYGIVDKNYDPIEVENNKGHNLEDTRPSKNIDFDSVRKKAYGNISEEIKENLLCENCEYLKEAKQCKKRENHIEEYNDDDDITMDEAAENYFDYGVEYKKSNSTTRHEANYYLDDDDEEEEEIKIVNHTEETEEPEKKPKKEIPPVKSSINLLSTLKKSAGDEAPKEKNLELTDDLFNLIDSMYDERNEDK